MVRMENDGIKEFVEDLKLGKAKSSFMMAMRTLLILEKIIGECQWKSASELIEYLQYMDAEVKKADETETVPSNIVLRTLKIIRDEYQRIDSGKYGEESLGLIQAIDEAEQLDYSRHFPDLKEAIQDALAEVSSEVRSSGENISKEAEKHINNGEVILTLGKSKTVEAFFKKAHKKGRKFQVIVAECAPFCYGHDLAISLAESGISTTVISDSSIFTHLLRATKVIIGTHSVMANGGLKAVSGAYTVALAAKHFNVPLLVLAAMFKYTPQFLISHDQVAFNKMDSPEHLLPYSHEMISSKADVVNPIFDYVPPELITVLIAGNKEGHAPSYVYHKLATMYHKQDYL